MKPKAGINTTVDQWDYVYGQDTQAELAELLDIDLSRIPRTRDPAEYRRSLAGAHVILATWRAHPLDSEILQLCPDLELVVYAAGSVKPLLTPELIRREIPVCSAVHINARPVAEFTLGLILMALKQVFHHNQALHDRGPQAWVKGDRHSPGGYYRSRVGLLGYGRVSAILTDLLSRFELEVYLSDPHLSDDAIRGLGVEPASVEDIMRTCDVVSLHHANTPANRHMINADNLALLKPGAHFVNTSRGQLVNEQHLVDRLERGDITAYLDVTHPEPPHKDHTFYRLPNCILTPHVAGSRGREVQRMGAYALREVRNWLEGRPYESRVDIESVYERG